MEKLYKRKTDGEIFKLVQIKPFILNSEIKETGSKFGIPFDMYVFQADYGEIEIEMYPKINERFEEVKVEKRLGTYMLKEIELLLGYDNDSLILDIEHKKSTIKFNNSIARVILDERVDSVSVDYEDVITIVYYSELIDKKLRMIITPNDKEHNHVLELFNKKYKEIIKSAQI